MFIKPAFAISFATATVFASVAFAQVDVEVNLQDGVVLKGSYFAASKPGPGVLLFHQSNRTRQSWDGVAKDLATSGIDTLTIDGRGHGDSGGKFDSWTGPDREQARRNLPADIDAAFQFLISQPGVNRDVIGLGGAGLLGVDTAVRTAKANPAHVKSLALLSGETFRPELQFLRQASQLPGLFVVDDNDEYSPTVEAMHLLYSTASNPEKNLCTTPPRKKPMGVVRACRLQQRRLQAWGQRDRRHCSSDGRPRD